MDINIRGKEEREWEWYDEIYENERKKIIKGELVFMK